MQDLEKYKFALGSASNLDQMLNEVYTSRLPKTIDYDNRRDLVRVFNVMAKEIYGNLFAEAIFFFLALDKK